MLKIYGSKLCPDCINCLRDLDHAGVAYLYFDFADQLLYLKEFLKIRDENPLFIPVKKAGSIGIPCIMEEDGAVSLEWGKYVGQAEA